MALVACLILLGFCLYQDLRYRGIQWFLFPLLFAASLWWRTELLWLDIAWNLSILFALMLALTVYVSVKEQRWVAITKGYFSWGDILFLAVVTPLFDPVSFLIFFTAGTCLSLVLHLLASLLKRQETIPYAGYMSLIGALALLFPNWLNHLSSLL